MGPNNNPMQAYCIPPISLGIENEAGEQTNNSSYIVMCALLFSFSDTFEQLYVEIMFTTRDILNPVARNS